MSSITETTANQDFYQVFMEPPKNALKMREFLHQACVLSTDEDFAKQHFVSSGYALLAWAVSFFENFKCAGKCLENCLIDVWHMDISKVLEQLSENGLDLVHSMKYTLVMPFIIFAGLFMPDPVYTSLDFPRYHVLGRGTTDNTESTTEALNRDDIEQQVRAAMQPEIDHIAQEVDQLALNLHDAEEQNEERIRENDDLVQRNDDLGTQYDDLTQRHEVLRNQIAALIPVPANGAMQIDPQQLLDAMADLQVRIADLQALNADIVEERDDLDDRLAEAVANALNAPQPPANLQDYVDQIAALTAANTQLVLDRDDLQDIADDPTRARPREGVLENQIAIMTQARADLEERLQQDIDLIEGQRDDLQRQLDALRPQLGQLQELEDIGNERDTLQGQLMTLQPRVEGLEGEVKDLQNAEQWRKRYNAFLHQAIEQNLIPNLEELKRYFDPNEDSRAMYARGKRAYPAIDFNAIEVQFPIEA